MMSAGALTVGRPERVAVVIPAKDEAERLEATIHAARSIDKVDIVVVVDDGSTDATSAIAKGANALVVRHSTNRGKAAAMATGAEVVAMRDHADAAAASGADDATVPQRQPRALLFLDADMGETASAAAPLVHAVLKDGVDMAIALLPPQVGAGGMGIVVTTARAGIERATGWTATQPLSGTRCITRETWDACQPLATGWGVETSLTIDALTGGFWVKEIPCELRHRATGNDMKGRLHRATQLRDVIKALARRRHVRPPEIAEATEETAVAGASELSHDAMSEDHEALPDLTPSEADDVINEALHGADATDPHLDAEEIREGVLPEAVLPIDGELEDEDREILQACHLEDFAAQLQKLPVDGLYRGDELAYLAGIDLSALEKRLRVAPVTGRFTPAQAVAVAPHLDVPPPPIPDDVDLPMDPEDWAILAAHAATDARNAGNAEEN